jgi:ABC-type multidrug transport system fused ATPase/permease subunit
VERPLSSPSMVPNSKCKIDWIRLSRTMQCRDSPVLLIYCIYLFFRGMGRKFAAGIQFTVTFFGGLGYGFYSSWRVSLFVLTVVPFMFMASAFLLKMNQTQTARANSSYAKAGSIVYMVRRLSKYILLVPALLLLGIESEFVFAISHF